MTDQERREAERLALQWLQCGNVPLRLDLAFQAGYAAAVEAKRIEHEAFCTAAQEKTNRDFAVTLEAAYKARDQLNAERARAAKLIEAAREASWRNCDEARDNLAYAIADYEASRDRS